MTCLKTQQDRVVVIVEASNSAAHSAARRFAHPGARVVLAGPNAASLIESAKVIRRAGGSATHVVANAAQNEGARAIRDHAELMFGAVDLWIDATAPRSNRASKVALFLMLSVGAALFGISRWVAKAN